MTSVQVLFNILSNEPVTETRKTCRGVFLILNQIPLTIIEENVLRPKWELLIRTWVFKGQYVVSH